MRTPGRGLWSFPTEPLAEAVAEEWNAQGEKIDPRTMPLTGLANAAIDRIAPDAEAFARGLAIYGESDLLCYRAESPPPLVERQAEAWDPILAMGAPALRRRLRTDERDHASPPARRRRSIGSPRPSMRAPPSSLPACRRW